MPRYAAIDIGSNSLRMLAAEAAPGAPLKILGSDRVVTRLGESVFRTGRVSPEAMETVGKALQMMAQQYKRLDVAGVRAVATSAIRDAGNQHEFLFRASQAIGAPVEIISGQEESRLIHLGVQSRWPHSRQSMLLIDIGGGSAETIYSENGRLQEAFSKPLGAVRLAQLFIRSDPPTPGELNRMEQYIEEKLAPVVERFHGKKWDRAVVTSGTAAAVVCTINRVGRAKIDQADQLRASTAQVRRLYEELCREDLAGRRRHTGIGPKRAEIIIPGAACLLRIMQDFDLPSVYYSAAGLRDGIIADLAARGVGMEPSGLDREQQRVVEAMARRYGVSLAHARQVAGLAASLFRALEPLHGLPPHFGRLLEAAAYLHDIGHFVSDTRHHRHSYYLVANSDMPGFTDRERTLVANLCRYHRKAMPEVEHDNLDPLNTQERRAVLFLTPLLRLADNLDRSHEQRIGSVECAIRNGQVQIKLGAKSDIDLEQWAAERATDAFRQVYGKPLVMSKARM